MEVRDITGFRTDLLKREYKQTDQWNEHFLGYSHEEQFGFFKLMHGKKADIRGFLTKEVQMAEDGQAIYEFIQNAADCDATHCWLFFDDEQFLVINNGAPFTAAGISSILNVGQSEGKLTPGKIGRFGIGFKLVHRLVGEDSGLDEMLADYAGPVMFSWSKAEQFQGFQQGVPIEPAPYDASMAATGTGAPWLLKILLTCFPSLPGEIIRDLNYQERVAFQPDELVACQAFLARHTAQLDPALFAQGTLTYLRLGRGKAQKLREEEDLLRRGVASSMHFLGRLQHIQVQDQPVARLDDVRFQDFSFPVGSPEWQSISLKDPRDLLSPVDIRIGFAPVESATAALRDEPAFYKYFPAGDETAPYRLVLHSNVISVESNRRKLHDNLINQQLLRLAAGQLATRLEELITADPTAACRIWAGLVLSDPPTASSHAWQRACFYTPLLAAAQAAVPTVTGFAPPAQVKIKHTQLAVVPADFGLVNLEWFQWPYGHEVTKAAAGKDKIGLEAWSIEDLLPRPSQAEGIQQWLDALLPEDWPQLRKELGEVATTKWTTAWPRPDKSTFTLWQRFSELDLFGPGQLGQRVSLNELQSNPNLLLLEAVNPTDQQVLEALGLTVFVLADQWAGSVLPHLQKSFAWLDPSRKSQGSQELLERIRQRLPDAELAPAQKHRLLTWLAALPGLAEGTLRKLALFRNAAGEVKPLDELAQSTTLLPTWLQTARLHPEEEALSLNGYLLKPSELYTRLIHSRWAEWKSWLTAGQVAEFCRTVTNWYELATDKSPLPGGGGALTEIGWAPKAQIFYQSALQQATSYADLTAALDSLYGWRVPVEEMLPWLAQLPFQLTADRLSSSTPSQSATLTAGQLRELLRLATADSADLTQQLTIRTHGDDYLLTPRQAGLPVQYFTTQAPLITYLTAELPDFHLLPAGKLLTELQRQVLREAKLYEALIHQTPEAQLLATALISLVVNSEYSTVQRLYMDRLPELEFEVVDAYPTDHPDRLLLQLAANPQVLAVEDRPAFRRRLSLSVPDGPAFLLDGAAENDTITLSIESDRTLTLSRAKLLPGSDQRSAYVNEWADQLAADEHLRDLLGLGTPADLPRLQTELLADLQFHAYQLQNATQLAFVLLTARYTRSLGTTNLLPRLTVLNALQQPRPLQAAWYSSSLPFLNPAYVLDDSYRTDLPALLGFEKMPRRWTIEGSAFELLRQPSVERDHFHCPGLLDNLDATGQAALLEFLYQRWTTIAAGSSGDWPANWTTIAGHPTVDILGFELTHTVDAPGFSLPAEELPGWVREWATRNSPTQKKLFLAALGVADQTSPVVQLRQAFQGKPVARAVELLAGFATSGDSKSSLVRTLSWLQREELVIATPEKQALLTEVYRRLIPEQFTAGIFTYLAAATEASCTYQVLPETEAVLLLDAKAYAHLTEHAVSVPQLLGFARTAGYLVLDLSIYPTEWQRALQGAPICVTVEYDRATLQNQATAVPLPRWLDAVRATVHTFPGLLPQHRTLLGQPLPDQAISPFWTDITTNCVYVAASHLPLLPDLLVNDREVQWSANELALLRQELLAQQNTQLTTSETELLALRSEIEQLRQQVAQQEEARRFAASLPVEPSTRKLRPAGNASPDDQAQLSSEAKAAVKAMLLLRGYDCTHWREEYTNIHGVTRDGQPVPIVVKRVGSGVLYITPNEWTLLASSPLAQLFVFDPTHGVRNISLAAVEVRNQQFFMQFDVGPQVVQGVKAFAEFFQFLPYKTHFVFDVPSYSHADEFTREFGLWQRHQPVEGDVSGQSLDSLD